MSTNKQIMDGCTAAAHVAYAMSEVATIYPITPIASMGETADKWAMAGRKNIFGSKLDVQEMESELGAAGATHGALAAGAFATTFTSSQGLLLMIPNMFKISGELLPGVFHVGTRSVAAHALSIFGDHQDVMACRSTGFTFLASNSVQETMDLALVAHLAAIDGSLPVVHFFDGWRTSNEWASIDVIPYSAIPPLVNWDKVKEFRDKAMNPEHPDLRGSAQNPDVYFQNREAANKLYNDFPAVVQAAMDRVASATGRQYNLVEYVGHPQADSVIIAMGSACQVIEETIQTLNEGGYKLGLVKVRLFRPFPTEQLLAAIPASVKRIAVLDRTKDPGADGEPLYKDVATAFQRARRDALIIGGRYGLSSKPFTPSMVLAVYDELAKPSPRQEFTVGINDDVTHLSLDIDTSTTIGSVPGVNQAIFYGMGSDGTVGATRQIASIISQNTDNYAQAYFNYSAKKSGGYTVSQLRSGPKPITAEYPIEDADYVGCNKDIYTSRFELVDNLKDGGIFVLNSAWSLNEMDVHLPSSLRRKIAQKHLRFYNIDAISLAAKVGLGVRINTIMATIYLHLMDSVVPSSVTIPQLKLIVTDAYKHEGGTVVQANLNAIDGAIAALQQVDYPQSWASLPDTEAPNPALANAPDFVRNVAQPCLRLEGDKLPVSAMQPAGIMPMGTTAYEKRRIAINIPAWDAQKCIQCTQCSLVCAHAAIRPYLITDAEMASAPADFVTAPAHAPIFKGMKYRIQVYPEDCTGCGSCAVVCPGHALTMTPIHQLLDQQIAQLDYVQKNVSLKENIMPATSIVGTQLQQPLLEFSGACAGCGETPYVKLLTQLFGSQMIIANATGCSSIWGANFPSNAYCVKKSNGHGPAWGNSLFEDNAEYGYGMACAIAQRRSELADKVKAVAADTTAPQPVVDAANAWIKAMADAAQSDITGRALVAAIQALPDRSAYQDILDRSDLLAKKSIWVIGGDGWAYDIGFAGLDHVLAQNVDINIFVMDTECYSNTGGQMSKATPLSCMAKYAADGKRTYKKDLGRMMMTYGTIYVASVALGANFMQTIKAFREAEAYPGPSIVIAYCPCIEHGIHAGMSHSIVEEKLAVKGGYWPLYRYNPALEASGVEPLSVDAPAPDDSLIAFINGEDRYADLRMVDPTEASILQPQLQKRALHIYSILHPTSSTKNPD